MPERFHAQKLREQAELQLKNLGVKPNLNINDREQFLSIIHEFEIHQIELEVQNDHLREVDAKLNDSQKRYFDLYHFSPVGHCTINDKGHFVEANLTAAKLFGLNLNELINRSISQFIFKDDQDIFYLFNKEISQTKQSKSCKLRMQKIDGVSFWVRIEGIISMHSGDIELPEIRLILIDIDENIKNHLRQQSKDIEIRDLYQALNTSSIVAYTDPKGIIVFANDKFCKISKYSKEELIGKSHNILKSGFHDDLFYKEMWGTISTGKPWSGEIKNLAKDGSYYWVMTTIIPFLNEAGEILRYASIRIDITEMKKYEQELRKSQNDKELVLEIIEEKSKFMDIVAHELRTPITALSLLLQLTEKQIARGLPITQDIIVKLKRPAERLAKLIADLLDRSRQDKGLMVLNLEEIDLVSLIHESIDELQILSPNRNIDYIGPKYSIAMNLDPLKIVQVISNLLDNALKYSNGAAIKILLEDSPTKVKISVIDQGPGINLSLENDLFSDYSRGNCSATNRASGLGLGLSLCKGIIELHHGSIGVLSKNGEGSQFYFELPKNN